MRNKAVFIMQPKQWLNGHCGLGLTLRTRTSPWMGWACSEAHRDSPSRQSSPPRRSAAGKLGEAALLGAPGKGARGKSRQAGLAVDHQTRKKRKPRLR